jgi:hypothetical protein
VVVDDLDAVDIQNYFFLAHGLCPFDQMKTSHGDRSFHLATAEAVTKLFNRQLPKPLPKLAFQQVATD